MKLGKILGLLIAIIVLCLCVSCSKTVTLTTMETDVQELNIMKYMIAELIERDTNGKFKIAVKPGTSSVSIAHEAMRNGNIDFNVNYTGTMYSTILQLELTDEYKNSKNMLDRVAKELKTRFNFVIGDSIGFNDTYVLAVNQDCPANTMSEFAKISSDYTNACEYDFYNREGVLSFSSMKDLYEMSFKKETTMDYALTYVAMSNHEVDSIIAYATDARCYSLNLKLLKDDKNMFPPYDGIVIWRQETLDKHSELAKYVNILDGVFTDENVQEANQMLLDGKTCSEVAHDLIIELGL